MERMKTCCFKLYSSHHNRRLHRHITKLKRTKRFAYMRLLDAQAVIDIAGRIDCDYRLFFSSLKRKVRAAPPGFKSRNIAGRVKTVTVKRDRCGGIYIYIVTDYAPDPVPAREGASIGYDFGLKMFLTASDGTISAGTSITRQPERYAQSRGRGTQP